METILGSYEEFAQMLATRLAEEFPGEWLHKVSDDFHKTFQANLMTGARQAFAVEVRLSDYRLTKHFIADGLIEDVVLVVRRGLEKGPYNTGTNEILRS